MADTDLAAKAAAHDAISRLPLNLDYIQQMLDGLAELATSDQTPATPAKSAKKRTRGVSHTAASAPQVIPGMRLPFLLAVLCLHHPE